MESNSGFGSTQLCDWVGQCSGAAWVGAGYLAAGLEGEFSGKLLGHLPGAIIGPAGHILPLWEVCLVPGNPLPSLLHALHSSTTITIQAITLPLLLHSELLGPLPQLDTSPPWGRSVLCQ